MFDLIGLICLCVGFCLLLFFFLFFFFKQKTAYEMRISDWSSDVCSSDLTLSTDSRWLARFRSPASFALRPVRRDLKANVRQSEQSAWRCVREAPRPRCADRGRRARRNARGTNRLAGGRRRAARRAQQIGRAHV